MRKEIPLLIAFVSGMLMICAYFSGYEPIARLQSTFTNWTAIVGGMAFLLATASLLMVNGEKISRKSEGWGFSVILIISFFVTFILGAVYGLETYYEKQRPLTDASMRRMIAAAVNAYAQGDREKWAALLGEALGTSDEKSLTKATRQILAKIAAKKGTAVPSTPQQAAALGALTADDMPLVVDVQYYNPFFFIYLYIYVPLSATMFSLLAFYIASAAYRAFKAKTKESTLLLGAAFLVMLGRVPIGEAISHHFTEIADWIMNVPNTAGQRAILIGAALGLVSSALRILLGLEQSYLGQD